MCKLNNQISNNGLCECKEGYYLGPIGECNSCHQDCLSCTNSNECIICADKNSYPGKLGCDCSVGYWKNPSTSECNICPSECIACTNNMKCLSCSDKYAILDEENKCVCIDGFYLENSICHACTNQCALCKLNKETSMKVDCYMCNKNYELISGACVPICGPNTYLKDGICLCKLGFYLKNQNCIQQYFSMNVEIHLNNSIKINFTEPLAEKLYNSNISIDSEIQQMKFELVIISIQVYLISILFEESVPSRSKFILKLEEPIMSQNNSILIEYNYSGKFYEFKYISETMKKIIKKTESASSSMNFGTICLALLSNPSAAWVLLNTIQLIYFLPIGQNSLTPGSIELCKAIGNFNGKMNLPKMFYNNKSLSLNHSKARAVGIYISDIWINLGSDITLLIGIIVLFPFVLLISKLKIRYLSNKFQKIKDYYRYSIFLRFFIQKNLAIGIFSFICFESVSNTLKIENFSSQSIFSFISSFIFAVISI